MGLWATTFVLVGHIRGSFNLAVFKVVLGVIRCASLKKIGTVFKDCQLSIKYDLSRHVVHVFGDRFNYTGIQDFLPKSGGPSWQLSLKTDMYFCVML